MIRDQKMIGLNSNKLNFKNLRKTNKFLKLLRTILYKLIIQSEHFKGKSII